MGTKRGRPKISEFVKYIIAYKVIQYSKRFNETPYKAWLRLVRVKAFKDLMQEHYKNTKHREHWVGKLTQSVDSQRKFYSKHLRKILDQFSKLKIYTPKEYKAYLVKNKAKETMGLGSLQGRLNKLRK